MAAFASDALKHFQHEATHNPNLPTAENSGLVGVTTNPRNNSYHHSKNSAPFKQMGAYTNRWPNDLVSNFPSINRDAVTGSDRRQSRADMTKSWKLHKAVFDDSTDPRRRFIAEYIGTPDGVNARRLDFADGSVDAADASHTWHEHEAWWYRYWDSWEAAHASLSIKRGWTKQQYIDSLNTEDEVAEFTPNDVNAWRQARRVEAVALLKKRIPEESGAPAEDVEFVKRFEALEKDIAEIKRLLTLTKEGK